MAGLLLRLYMIWHFPFADADDSRIYDELARNWMDHRVYGVWLDQGLTPVDLRAPGYPAFLVFVYSVFGRNPLAVFLVQALLDLLTCGLCAAIAGHLAPANLRVRVRVLAFVLGALCPFTANYTAALLTETLAAFLNTLALLLFLLAIRALDSDDSNIAKPNSSRFWFLGSLCIGLGALVRPETPLLLAVVAIFVGARFWRPENWEKLVRVGLACLIGLVLPLVPWAWRNYRTLHEVQFLAPRFAEMPGEYVARGFYDWTRTWLVRFGDVYNVTWKMDSEPIVLSDIPPEAFDTPEEIARVSALIARQNITKKITPEIDTGFTQLARERNSRHPFRTWLTVPAGRALTIWFTPRLEMLPYSGKIWPVAERWQEDSTDFCMTLLFGALNLIYAGLALWGAWRVRTNSAGLVLISVIAVRTLFLTQIETPEPRYLIPVFPLILALGAQALRPILGAGTSSH